MSPIALQPGYGAAAAVALGLGTMVLPLSTLLFSHVFTAFLGFGAFALMLRERDGPASPMLLALAGLAMGYAVASEYPLFFVALVLGLYLLSRRDALTPLGVCSRAGAYIAGGIVGIVPLLLYNHYAFHSWTHLAYSDVPRQQKGFFGIGAPSLKVLATLLLDSRGLLTLSPVLVMGALGTVLLYKRGKRAEALTIAGVCLCYVGYNSGYYLPFGGGFMGPRFLTTMLPFLAFPLSIAFKRWPGPTVALAGVSIATTVIATITHPLVGYETETVVWARYLREGFFQPTIASAYGLGRGWGGDLAVSARSRRRGGARRMGHAAHAPVKSRPRRRRARGARLGAVRGARADAAAASTIRACSTSRPRATARRCTRALAPIRCARSRRWPPRPGSSCSRRRACGDTARPSPPPGDRGRAGAGARRRPRWPRCSRSARQSAPARRRRTRRRARPPPRAARRGLALALMRGPRGARTPPSRPRRNARSRRSAGACAPTPARCVWARIASG